MLCAGLAMWAILVHRKRPYAAFTGSLQGAISSSKPEVDESMTNSPPGTTSNDDSSPRHSLDLRRAHSDTLASRRSLKCMVRPMNSDALLEEFPLERVSRHLSQHRAHLEMLGFAGSRRIDPGRNRRCSGGLSMAAHAELVAAQVKDEETMTPGDEEMLQSNYGSSNPWRSSNTSSSSQTHATIQRFTRLDTAAWQIAYSELKFSRLIGEGSFGRVFLGKWRETTVAIKLLNPPARKPLETASDSDEEAGCALSGNRPKQQRQQHKHQLGLLDDLDKEAAIMAALRHPNVVMFLGVCLDPPCVVAEVLCTALQSLDLQCMHTVLQPLTSQCPAESWPVTCTCINTAMSSNDLMWLCL